MDIRDRLANAPTDGADQSNGYTLQARHCHEAVAEIDRLRAIEAKYNATKYQEAWRRTHKELS